LTLDLSLMKALLCSVQVTPNLYGNLVANTAAGIAGGTGVMPGGMNLVKVLILQKTFTYLL